jgi:hypothetical protein
MAAPPRSLTVGRHRGAAIGELIVRPLDTVMRFVAFTPTIALAPLPGCERQQTTSHTKRTMMTLQRMEEMFANMRAKTKWDVDGEMLWGYFFTDPDTNKLERAPQRLTTSGYRLVQIYRTDDKSTCVLHVERIEKHTPQTLQTRNSEFEKLAAEFGLESYDGMDVGPVLKQRA